MIVVDDMIGSFTFLVDFFYARCYHASVTNKIYLFINKVQFKKINKVQSDQMTR